ncbi:meiotic recombination protein SPO11-like [Pollicipes pollicipes]|uniref:meiotic recombination protein SPO11-like n=1 Tax=Pollicipes pollicipes TaxID=41117 RepID=UPI001884ECA8|nr:meiotic recombination protein SPO11-like [Pollicipes pollicipes]
MRVRKESKLNMMVLLLEKIRHLVATNTHSTKRDIYYQEVALFGSQRAVDALLDDVTRLLAIPRQSSHVRATSKGLVAGDLDGLEADGRDGRQFPICSSHRPCRSPATAGLLVPEDLPHVQLVRSSARFILVVEKDATFQKILDSRLLRHLPPGIVITGKGFPDLNTRLLLRLLTTQLQVPALALLDADPHGLEILFVYKYGSLARAHEAASLATPDLMWLGLRPTEVLQLNIPQTGKRHSKLAHLTPFPVLSVQIREILASGRKAEIQTLSALHPTFLTDLYLPSKIGECLSTARGELPAPAPAPEEEPYRESLRSGPGAEAVSLGPEVIQNADIER